MFETPQTKGETSGTGMWVGILVVVALIIGGVVFFMGKKDAAPNAAPAAASAAAPAQTSSDAVKDLHIASAKMDKDYTGTTAMWSVEIRNLSKAYTYSAITYQTTYIGADNTVLGTNRGTIPSFSLEPGESQSVQFRDALYPSGTAIYNFKILGATAAQ